MKIQNVKGGYDYTPQEQRIRNYINDTLRKIFEEYGYNSIETPIITYFDILSDKYDEDNDILKEIYRLKDQGGRELGLRYDLTVPFAKFIALNKNNINLPFKRYEINKAFRDGPVKVGRDREFTQCDVDVVGIDGEIIEAELLTLYVRAFDELNIPIIIKYNNRNLMNGLILESGIDESLLSKVTTIIDKKEKLNEDVFKDELRNIGLIDKQIEFLFKTFNLTLKELNTNYGNTENIILKKGIEEINNLSKYIEELGLTDSTCLTLSLARGQNYYTGNVFEVYDKEERIQSSIGGGGRYDKMITNFINDGYKYPAVGISFGLSSIYELLKTREEFQSNANVDLYIIPMNTNTQSLKLANSLRSMGLKVDIAMNDKKLKKNLDYANKMMISYVIVLGENEINDNKVIVKNMFSKGSYEVNLDNIEGVYDIINEE